MTLGRPPNRICNILFLRTRSIRAIEIDAVHVDTFRGARAAVQTEIDDAAVSAFAQFVLLVTDSNGQGVFLFRVESFAQDIDPVQVQSEAVFGNK